MIVSEILLNSRNSSQFSMETDKKSFAKQYNISLKAMYPHQQPLQELPQNGTDKTDAINKTLTNITNIPFQANFTPLNVLNSSTTNYHVLNNYSFSKNSGSNDEPMDLSTFRNKNIKNLRDATEFQESITITPCPQDRITLDQSSDYYPKRRRRRRKFAYTTDGKLVLVPNEEALQSPSSFSESKQLEILKAAKSLFSKRTRTLYHWMYPNAAKQQIKTAVASSWESLGTQEKDFYISQVLGRFGFPQSSLMVNPQLGGIKELPPILETPENKSKCRELQSAISSIMPDNPMPPGLASNSLTFEEFEEINELTKKRRGRPPGSSNKKQKFDIANGTLAQDFKDDPELSQELEQFATMFNLSKI